MALAPPSPRRAAWPAAAILAASLGCQRTLDAEKIQQSVEHEATTRGWAVKAVACPGERVIRAGDEFDCALTFKDGRVVAAHVAQVDDKGNVQWQLRRLVSNRRVEASIREWLEEDGGPPSSVRCPAGDVSVLGAGQTLSCTAVLADAVADAGPRRLRGSPDGGAVEFEVRAKDDLGTVDFSPRR